MSSSSPCRLPRRAVVPRRISAWDATDGKLVRVFKGHGHWVNTLALSSEHVLRTGAYDHNGKAPKALEEAKAQALQR